MDQLDPRRWLSYAELDRARTVVARAFGVRNQAERLVVQRRQEAVMTGLWLYATRDSGWQEASDLERQAVASRLGFVRWLRDQERISDAV